MSALAFELPPRLEAPVPPEVRGLERDGVRLMSTERGSGRITHTHFSDLPQLLRPGDLLVVNVSATLPAAIDARRGDGSKARVHVASRAPRLDPDWRVVELRSASGARPARGRPGEVLELSGGGRVELVAPYASGHRLMLARWSGAARDVEAYLGHHGQPIRYGYVSGSWPLGAYQTVFAAIPGSAEMPSAGRPFTPELLARLIARDVPVAPITLHAGVSSPERHEAPIPESFDVPEATAHAVQAARSRGGRVIAVGTTVVRALETAASHASLRARSGWTSLVITPEREPRVVDGLITGWHEPEASHLALLEAVAGRTLLERAYSQALAAGYLWHEFGDSHLILP